MYCGSQNSLVLICLTSRPEAVNKVQLSSDTEQGPDLGMFVAGREPKKPCVLRPTRASSGQMSFHLLKVTKVCSGFSDCRAPICNRQHFLSLKKKKILLCLVNKPVSSFYLLSWHLQKPWGTRPVCPSQAASGRTGGYWRRTAPRQFTLAPFTRAPVLPWSPLSSRENQIPAKCLIQTINRRNTTTTTTKSNTEKQERHTRPAGRWKWASGTRSFRGPTEREVTTCCRSGVFVLDFYLRHQRKPEQSPFFYSLCCHLSAPAWIKDPWESPGAPRPSLQEKKRQKISYYMIETKKKTANTWDSKLCFFLLLWIWGVEGGGRGGGANNQDCFSRTSDNNPKRYQDWKLCHDEMTTDICTHNNTNEIYWYEIYCQT